MGAVQTHLDVAEAWAFNNRALLARVFNHWLEKSEWPTVEEVGLAVLREDDEEVYEALRSLPGALGRIEPPQQRIELRVRSLASVDRAEPFLDAFVRALMLAASTLRQGGAPPLTLSDTDLTGTLSMPAAKATRVAELLFRESWLWYSRSGNTDGSWHCNLGESFLPVAR